MKYRFLVATLIITVGVVICGIRQVSAQPTPSKEAIYSDDFSSYTPGSPPIGWILRGADQVTPIVKNVGGTGALNRLLDFPEVPWQYWDRWLLKDGLTPQAPYIVTVKLNFRNNVADRGGLTIAWNDANWNRIDIQPNVYGDDIEFRVTYNGSIQSNALVNNIGHIPINPFTDYWMRVVVKDDRPGQGELSVLWSTDGTHFRQVISATGVQDLKGLVGVSTAGPHLPHMYFDDFSVSTPAEGPGVYLSKKPDGKAPNLIVLVHGCCTKAEHLSEWNALADKMLGEIIKVQAPRVWEIVVWDWHHHTPTDNVDLGDWIKDARTAYENITDYSLGFQLANAIANYPYMHVHLIGHSAGAKLIDVAAKELVRIYRHYNERPFIHLTFLDAFTLTDWDTADYGSLPSFYPNHYAEHYVHKGLPSTDATLKQAFNFDITSWKSDDPLLEKLRDKAHRFRDMGHQWPRYWYEKSVTTPGFKYGYPLSLEGGYNQYNLLAKVYPPGGCKRLVIKEKEEAC